MRTCKILEVSLHFTAELLAFQIMEKFSLLSAKIELFLFLGFFFFFALKSAASLFSC